MIKLCQQNPSSKADCICLNQSCLLSNTSFFSSDSMNSFHETQHSQQITLIHKRYFKDLFQKRQSKKTQNDLYSQSLQNLDKIVHNCKRIIIDFINEQLFTRFYQSIKIGFDHFKQKIGNDEIKLDEIIDRLEHKDQYILNTILQYRKSEVGSTFSEYYQYQKYKQQNQIIFEDINKTTEELIEKMKEWDKKIAFLQSNKKKLKDFYEQNMQNTPIAQNVQEQYQIKIQNEAQHHQQRNCQNRSFSYDQVRLSQEISHKSNPLKQLKTKKIMKQDHNIKKQKVKRINIPKPTQVSFQAEEVRQVKPGQICIQYSRSVAKTLSHILKKYDYINKVNIFSSSFARSKTSLLKLFQKYEIQQLTFNCSVDLSESFYYQIPFYKRSKLMRVDTMWAIDKYFQSFIHYHIFQVKNWQQLIPKHLKAVNNALQLLPHNNTLELTSKINIPQQINLQIINYLHIFTVDFNRDQIMINRFKEFSFLLSLDLKDCIINQSGFKNIVSNNKHLRTVSIYLCFFYSDENKILRHLASLPSLQQLCLVGIDDVIVIHPSIISNLKSLTSLSINATCFSYGDNHDNTLMSSSILYEFRQLKQLKHFCVNGCEHIYSDILDYLDEKVLLSLQTLSIGVTFVDNTALPKLKKMKNLKYLDIQLTKINANQLLQALKTQSLQSGSKYQLRYLNIAHKFGNQKGLKYEDTFTVDILKQIAQICPQITVLCIYGCRLLNGYDFKEFNKLRNLQIDKNYYKINKDLISHLELSIIT